MTSIGENLEQVREKITRAAVKAGRPAETIKLIGVSKTIPAHKIAEAVNAGQFRFGENRVQEADSKIPLIPSLPNRRLEWHLVGHLQSNKAKKAAALFDWIHSVDSARLLAKLDEGARSLNKVLSILIQINLAKEPNKAGADGNELERMLAMAGEMKNVSVEGLMLIPPFLEDPEAVRPFFRELRELSRSIASRHLARVRMRELSMGMSHDYEIAIEEGASMVRVGRAIFGTRR